MTPFRAPLRFWQQHINSPSRTFLALGIPAAAVLFATAYRRNIMTDIQDLQRRSTSTSASVTNAMTFSARPLNSKYTSDSTFPYSSSTFAREDSTDDSDFYSSPRYVTHIDDHAISRLRAYYANSLPQTGHILDLCSSWISHFPPELEVAARDPASDFKVTGLGLNSAELSKNPILSTRICQNLNIDPALPSTITSPSPDTKTSSEPSSSSSAAQQESRLSSTVCVVSIDYLTQPVQVLSSVLKHTITNGTIHLVLSNRCFPTKAIRGWLRRSENERIDFVGDLLALAGWKEIEVVVLSDGTVGPEEEKERQAGGSGELDLGRLMGMFGMGSGRVDPLWVVRAKKA